MGTFLGLTLAVAGVAAIVTGVSGRGPQLFTAITGMNVPAKPAPAASSSGGAGYSGPAAGSTPGNAPVFA